MLYENNKKIYLKVSENFIECDIKKDKNGEYTIIPKEDKVEVYGNQDKFYEISLEQAYEKLNKSNSDIRLKSKLEDEKFDK